MKEINHELKNRIIAEANKTTLYEWLATVFFFATKIIQPVGSALITLNLSAPSLTEAGCFASPEVTIGMGSAVLVSSGLDAIFNFSLLRDKTHRKNIALVRLSEKFSIDWKLAETEQERGVVLHSISKAFRDISLEFSK
ncbi:MAG: hypothetical protein DRQ49_07740 [Gammaproteobacteria bacterium]|nr:MAG: hypothetical protein DRQ49_07740 [Gammaproteobacteria bacterium]RKZ73056.1 MAG: hypothetical protein DRQ57_15620 [Gammaproteobacteria bacterium]